MELKRLGPDDERPAFCCGDPDLDEFYRVDSINGGRQLLSVTYAIIDGDNAVAFFSVSNDSINKELVQNSAFKRLARFIPHEKRYRSLPATKIGRFGVSENCQRKNYGTLVMDFLKVWFTTENKTGCRFLIVDAYNIERAIRFYESNGFKFLTSEDKTDPTRIMYFDLITFTA
ncbi:MAG: GNAT family N-acetyltransferase [Gammaproteobacteria bacterium]|nr:GNAT family N-acetyltransferase [Gammaproteobacteria bacterium]